MRRGAGGGSELGRFLRARRAQVRPESVGLPAGLGYRRVPGLRRDELATLSGISAEYYVRLEQGKDDNPSPQVLEALARALRLDEEATAHLYRVSRPLPGPAPVYEQEVSSVLAGVMELWPRTPAFVADRLGKVLAANALARLLSPAYRPGTNMLRTLFLDPDVRGLYADWDGETEALVAAMRSAVSGGPQDPALDRLVAELSAGSERFRELWVRHDMHVRAGGTTAFDHPLVGAMELRYEKLAVLSPVGPCPKSAGQQLFVFQAEPGTESARRLASLMDAETAADTRGLESGLSELGLEHGVVVG